MLGFLGGTTERQGASVDLSPSYLGPTAGQAPDSSPEPVADVCYNGWQQPVEVDWKAHRFAVVTHRCKKQILHTTDHECRCGTVWTKG